MPFMDAAHAYAADGAQPPEQDLGPLAWVHEELRKSLDGALKSLRRFVREAAVARESDLAALDSSALRMARQQLHQAGGALEMVGMAGPALVLRSMEAAVQKFVQRPDQCGEDAIAVLERASFALVEYLELVLAGKPASPVGLFPQYRDVQALTGAERVHPADLWPVERDLREPDMPLPEAPLPYGPAARARLDSAVLRIVKHGDAAAAGQMRDVCLGLAAANAEREPRTFWKLCAGFFDAFAAGRLPTDVYVKRVASRVLMQYASLARGDAAIADRLVQDLLFFCAQARVPAGDAASATPLHAVQQTFGQQAATPVDYEQPRFGRHDPAVLAQARRRIAATAETWSALAGGDRSKHKPAADQFGLVCDSLARLYPGSEALAGALTRAVDTAGRAGGVPPPDLAMEVATSVLYLQAAFEEPDTAQAHLAERGAELAQRLDHVAAGGEPAPLEAWMEELYRRVSDHQTMGSVVGELRASLAETEKAMDQFFRQPEDLSALTSVPDRLAQMRGVLSVLGLDQASLAALRMRDTVERLLAGQVDEADRPALFEKLGNSLGALGFLIDMLGYQRSMARKLFVYDEVQGELRLRMGRARELAHRAQQAQEQERPPESAPQPAPAAEPAAMQPEALAEVPPAAAEPEPAPMPVEAAEPGWEPSQPADPGFTLDLDALDFPAEQGAAESLAAAVPLAPEPLPPVQPLPDADDEDQELLDIFLDEAREVVATGLAAVQSLRAAPGDLSEQTTLRRAFHTLKGSSRMVGLAPFGDAAWAMEQALNAWLAEQKPAPADLLDLSEQSLQAFGRWADAIAAGDDSGWQTQPFVDAASALRAGQTPEPLRVPGAAPGLTEAAPELLSGGLPGPAEENATATEAAAVAAGEEGSMPAAEAGPADAPEAWPAQEMAQEIDFADFMQAVEASDAAVAAQAHDAVGEAGTQTEEGVDEPAVADVEADAVEAVAAEAETLLPAIQEPEPLVAHAAAAPLDGADAVEPADAWEPTEEAAIEPASPVAAQAQPADEALPPELPVPEDEPAAVEAPDLLESGAAQKAAEPAEALEPAQADEAVKVIGTLRIGIPLYNVYLNEADEWSRRLSTALQEWSLELHEPLPDMAVALAHSLAGSSATVGFSALSEMARTLEHALEHVRWQPHGVPEQAAVFVATAEDIRRLLHQFAAGFLKEPNPQLMDELRAILHTEAEMTPPDSGAGPEASDAAWADQEPQEGLADMLPPQEPSTVQDIDDEIDARDVIDPDLFPIFEEEAAELLPGLGAALRQWVARPGNMGARNELLRGLHTLKGSARLAGAMRLGAMAHRMESAVEQIDAEAPRTEDIEPLLTHLDGLQAGFNALRALGAQPPQADAARAGAGAAPQEGQDAGTAPAAEVMGAAPAARGAPPAAMQPRAAGPTVRVRAQLLDRLVNQAGEVMIARSRLDARVGQMRTSLGELSGNLERLRQQLRDIEVQAETQMQSRLALSKDAGAGFDPLEFDRFTRVQELTRMMAESVNDVATVQRNLQRTVEAAEDDLIAQGRQARELQRDLLRTRMVEFDGIAERLYAVVRQASKEAGKQIKLDIEGGSIEMDRGVLDRMAPAFEHLLRNSVAHGIERPEQRVAAGKPAVGRIAIALRQEGNDVAVEFSDDGAGLDLERIRARAVAQGLLAEGAELEAGAAAQLIFQPGFSTAAGLTELSGRGIGMDVVRSEVQALGGRIETQSRSGEGTSFRMVLPLTTAVTQVVMLRAGHQTIGVPASLVEIVRRTTVAELDASYAGSQFHDGVESIPFFWLGALLQSSPRSDESASKTRPVVVLRSAAQRIAMHVDEVLGNQEVVVKNLGPQLSRLPGLAGMSVLASGAVVLIYNPVALATVYGDQARALAQAGAEPAGSAGAGGIAEVAAPAAGSASVPLVLVVDDSITVRRVTQRLLQREGYRVALASDGLQALERLQLERPALVLSDIEMPRMDGFDLARNIRGDAVLRDLPIVMITSRIARKHREHAMELGVNHYLGKPYSDEELLGLVEHYARKAELTQEEA